MRCKPHLAPNKRVLYVPPHLDKLVNESGAGHLQMLAVKDTPGCILKKRILQMGGESNTS